MLSLQFTCEYTIQVVAFKRLFNLKWENVRSLGKVDREFYQPCLPHSSEALQTDVKSDIFVADFPLDPHFFGLRIFMRFVGWNKGHFLFSNCL